MAAVLPAGMDLEVVEGTGDHAYKPFTIRAGGTHLNFGVEGGILESDATAVEVEVHASKPVNEFLESGGGIGACHVQHCTFHLSVRKLALQRLQEFFPTSGYTNFPTLFCQQAGHFASDA